MNHDDTVLWFARDMEAPGRVTMWRKRPVMQQDGTWDDRDDNDMYGHPCCAEAAQEVFGVSIRPGACRRVVIRVVEIGDEKERRHGPKKRRERHAG